MAQLPGSLETGALPPPRLLNQMRGKVRLPHYAIRTEEAHVYWVRRFILFQGKRHPRDMTERPYYFDSTPM